MYIHINGSVVAWQRYLCSNVIPMTMSVFIVRNLLLKTVLFYHMPKYSIRYRCRSRYQWQY